jgi:glycosyltransferase involved in cell wall biosynthesis
MDSAMLISVVTPSYNQGEFIERTLQSVLSQNIAQLEYVVFDGGSSDNTVEVLKKYQDQLRWVSEKDGGQTNAVNKGLMATSGEIIGWLNSDDIYYPGAFETVLDFFKAHPEIDIVYGQAYHIDKQDGFIDAYPTEAWDINRLQQTCFISQPAVFFRRSIIERFGLLDESMNFCMDYEYWLRLGLAGAKFAYIPKVLAATRLYAETKTLGARVKVHAEINDMFKKKLGKVSDRWLFNYGHIVADSWGLKRSNELRFGACMGVMTLYASLRWNHSISIPMMKMLAGFVKSSGKAFLTKKSRSS